MDFLKININLLNEKARLIFETSDNEALKDLFLGCETIEDINKSANELYNSGIFED